MVRTMQLLFWILANWSILTTKIAAIIRVVCNGPTRNLRIPIQMNAVNMNCIYWQQTHITVPSVIGQLARHIAASVLLRGNFVLGAVSRHGRLVSEWRNVVHLQQGIFAVVQRSPFVSIAAVSFLVAILFRWITLKSPSWVLSSLVSIHEEVRQRSLRGTANALLANKLDIGAVIVHSRRSVSNVVRRNTRKHAVRDSRGIFRCWFHFWSFY